MFRNNYSEGDKIGELIFVRRAENKPGRPAAIFLCECGKELFSRIDAVKNLRTKSCGCKTKDFLTEASRKYPEIKYINKGIQLIPTLDKIETHRFWSKVALTANPDKCWNWQANGQRYGHFRIGKGQYKSNRIAYFLYYGVDPKEMYVLHKCDNPKCCNPNHLFLGTHDDNMKDMAKKGRARLSKTKQQYL